MNKRLQFYKFSPFLLFLLALIACSKQIVILPTETPAPISAPASVSVTFTPSPTEPVNVLSSTLTPSSTPFLNSDGLLLSEQQEEIKKTIASYFEMRYQALSYPQPEGFELSQIGNLVSLEEDARAFLDEELAKLSLQIKYGELNGSRYVTYRYFLDFSEFSFDVSTKTASVLVIEDSETTSENSSLLTRISGEKHIIILRKEQGEWKIVSDYYNDFLWRNIRQKDQTIDDILNRISTIEALITPNSTP